MLFHGYKGYWKAPRCYVISTMRILYHIERRAQSPSMYRIVSEMFDYQCGYRSDLSPEVQLLYWTSLIEK
jgi:hypothetical protein